MLANPNHTPITGDLVSSIALHHSITHCTPTCATRPLRCRASVAPDRTTRSCSHLHTRVRNAARSRRAGAIAIHTQPTPSAAVSRCGAIASRRSRSGRERGDLLRASEPRAAPSPKARRRRTPPGVIRDVPLRARRRLRRVARATRATRSRARCSDRAAESARGSYVSNDRGLSRAGPLPRPPAPRSPPPRSRAARAPRPCAAPAAAPAASCPRGSPRT